MGGKKICITVPEDVFKNFETSAKDEGFLGVPAYVRHAAICDSKKTEDSNGAMTVKVKIEKAREIIGYVSEKGFGGIESFAVFAMSQYMARYPLTPAQKERAGKLAE